MDMDSNPFAVTPRFRRGIFFSLFLFLLCCVGVVSGFSTAIAADKVTLSWRANPQDDNVLGYRLYFGARSRFDNHGGVRSGFSYPYYFDFTDSQRCQVTASGPVCRAYTRDEVRCEQLYSEKPKCTLYNLDGQHYFAMTAYNAQAESNYTKELSGLFRNADAAPASVLGTLQAVYTITLF